MATFKLIAEVQPTAASNTSLSSAFYVPPEMDQFALKIPTGASFCITTTCRIGIQAADTEDGTYYDIAYSDNPATTTSGHGVWGIAGSATVSGARVICEALAYASPWARLRFVNTATAQATFAVYGRISY